MSSIIPGKSSIFRYIADYGAHDSDFPHFKGTINLTFRLSIVQVSYRISSCSRIMKPFRHFNAFIIAFKNIEVLHGTYLLGSFLKIPEDVISLIINTVIVKIKPNTDLDAGLYFR